MGDHGKNSVKSEHKAEENLDELVACADRMISEGKIQEAERLLTKVTEEFRYKLERR